MKLERDEVRTPSPHLLRALSKHYGVSYLSLMSAAGYETTDSPSGEERDPESASLIADALASERFTHQEREAISAFIVSLRARRKHDDSS